MDVRRSEPNPIGRSGVAALIAIVVLGGLLVARPAAAYSVLAHEANIDALWESTISPMLLARFPGTTPEQLTEARAYAYGGSVIQDLGYYPFGSHSFSNLLHYVRTGEFVAALIRDASNVNEYAFALGALGHYAADNNGHPLAVNRAVALMYPKLKKKFGDTITYVQSPTSHVLVEFSFDVVQVAAGAYAPSAYHSYIGFQVATPLLERAFHETYGIEMKDLFLSESLAVATYRHAVGTTIPEMTKVAWGKKRAEILKVTPGKRREEFVFHLSRKDYDRQFGSDYAKPHGFARFLALIYQLIPKIGPFRSLRFSVPTPEAERLFLQSFTATREHFRELLQASQSSGFHLPNSNLDTGQPTARGQYSLTDTTYDELLNALVHKGSADSSPELIRNIAGFYGAIDPSAARTPEEQRRLVKARDNLSALVTSCGCP